jgi:hypothetical protein
MALFHTPSPLLGLRYPANSVGSCAEVPLYHDAILLTLGSILPAAILQKNDAVERVAVFGKPK